ncbi:MAG: tetratricopeptide (TPR) repeat protein, partial [Cyclobacteriaceae bacterium]
MFRQVIVFVFFLSCIVSAFGQSGAVIDSLRKQSQVLSSPEYKANVYNQLAWEFRDTRPDSALYYTTQALKIAKEFGYSRPQIQAYNYMGVAYRNLSVFSKAFEMYLEALRLSELYDDLEQRGYTLINLGNLYLYQTNFQGAINYFIQALDQAQSLGNRRMQAYCF